MQKRIAVLLSVMVLGLAARAQTEPRPDEKQTPGWVEQALRGPDRHEIAWNVRIQPPRLTYQQRNLVEVRLTVDAGALKKRPTDLEFLVKVADDQGRWLPGENYNRFPVPAEVTKNQEIQFAMGMYLRPGAYSIATLVYERGTGALNVERKKLEIPALGHDPLPSLDRDLPVVEFLPDVPHDSDSEPAARPGFPPWLRRRFPGAATAAGVREDPTWALGSGREWLPIASARPLRVDVVLNFSNTENRREAQESALAYRQNVGLLLQVGSVLSHLSLARGCVRVHGVDVIRMRKMFDMDGSTPDWEKISHEAYNSNRATVDVGTLAGRKQASAFFRDYLLRLFAETGCGAGDQAAQRAVVVVSRDVEFPSGTKIERLAQPGCNCRLYYLELPASNMLDQVGTMLKPLNPRRFRVADPRQFRDALADMLRELGPAAADRAR